ncbi:uncharacterized protein LOC123508400 [Portunus trituberculatus]|uniref:uncharacterized protein LOC123508400 n=1 Tax=Portunus trituberculatus TaxID=210409 RepID=UPI001E1CDF05|nr:uncharacterized protein LOC123508400 [Portunus trituberculatus]
MVMEVSRYLVLVAWAVAISPLCGADLPKGFLVNEVTKGSLSTCQLVLMVSTPLSPLLLTRHRQIKRSFIMVTPSVQPRNLRRALAGDSTTTCRGLIIHLDDSTPNATTGILKLLERAELWQVPETRLVVLGGKKEVKTVLLNHSLRNTINGLYLAMHKRRCHHTNTTYIIHRIRLRILCAFG